MKIKDPQSRLKLSQAINRSYESLSWGRRTRRQLIEDFAGPRYGSDGFYMKPDVYVNLIQIAINAYQVSLAYNDPRCYVTARTSEYASFAERFQVALNSYSQSIGLGETIREIVRDAVFLVGIGKIYLADSAEVYDDIDFRMDPGMPFFGRVSFDNWVHDVTKSDFRYAQFFGDRITMDLEKARNCPSFNKTLREGLEATHARDRNDSEYASYLTREDEFEEIEETVDLINVYLPKEKLVCTWPLRGDFELDDTPPLATLDWNGPETGPYRFLSFIDVPDNIMPTSPAQTLCPLSYLYNYLFRKIARRAKTQKDVIHYEAGQEGEVGESLQADDMQSIRVTHMKGINIMKYPGPDQGLMSFTYGLQEIFKQAAGNIDAMVGLAPTAGTLGQSQLIDQKVGMALAGARSRVNRFVGQVFTDLGWLLFDDPVQTIPGERDIPGTGMTMDASWLPPDQMERPADFDRFDIKFETCSMEYKSNADRLAALQQDLQLLGPMIPIAQQMGMEFQFQEVLNRISELRDDPNIKRWFRVAPPPSPPAPDAGLAMRPPGTGQYTRTSVSEKSGDGQLQALMQQQPQEQAVGLSV